MQHRRRTAAYPEQPRQVHSHSCCRFRMQGVGDIYPGAYLACLSHAADKCERQRGPSGAFRSNHLTEGADRESATQQKVDLGNACRRNRVGKTRHRRECRRNPFRQASFYLCAQMAGGRHGIIFALFSPIAGLQCQPVVVGNVRPFLYKRLKVRRLYNFDKLWCYAFRRARKSM